VAGAAAGDDVVAGIVGRPHGLDGSFHVQRAVKGLLTLGMELRVGDRPARVERLAGTPERPIVRVSDVADREAASALNGAQLWVPAATVPELGPEEWWAHELEGCRVTDGEREVGVVRALRVLPSCEVLEVERSEGAELLVPLVRDAVRSVDVEARLIDVDLRFLDAG
jgi:16S rRNA processing protein RimM